LFNKINIWALFVFLSCTAVFAQVAQDGIYEISDFSKLMQSQVSPYTIEKGKVTEAKNLRSNTIYGSINKRDAMLSYGTAGDFAITGMHRFYKADDTKYLLVSGSTYLKVGNDDTGEFTTIRDLLSDGYRWQFVTYKDIAIGCNGVDNCQKYDGKTTTTANTDGARSPSVLTADLGAPFAELNTGSNLDASSWYQYKIGFYDGTNYYYSNARSNPILTGSTVRDLALTDIPLGPSGTTARYIYRTVGDASRSAVGADTSFYRVATLSDNTTTSYSDVSTDSLILADGTPTWATVSAGINLTPPVSKYNTIHNERLWLANNPTYNSDIYWSYPYKPQVFYSARDYEPVRPDDGDEVTFIKSFLGTLTIGKNNTVQKFFTDNTDSTKWVLSDPFSFVGCIAPYSAQVTPYGLIYLSHDGLYNFTGETSNLSSDSVTSTIKDISKSNYSNVSSVYKDNLYQLSYSSDESGSATNNRVLVFDFVRDAFSIDTKNVNSFAVFNSGSDFGSIYSGSSAADGKVYVDSYSPNTYVLRYKSQFDAGTNSSISVSGTEEDPQLEIGWGVTVGSITLAGVTVGSITYSSATIATPGTTGIWYSPTILLNSNSLSKLYWNETLGDAGNVTLALRMAASSASLATASWSSEYSDPSGSDISGLTGNTYSQIRATLTTTDITKTPYLNTVDNYVIKLTYSKEGAAAETNIPSVWKSGFINFNTSIFKKRIREILVFYSGTTGKINFAIENNEGDINTSFNIDLATDPDTSTSDQYTGGNTYKVYQYLPPINSSTNPTPIGESFRFTITESGIQPWSIYKILVKFDVEEGYE
jgi:hypothetical protein